MSAQGDEGLCPLCIEPLDPTEKEFFPCPCGYALMTLHGAWLRPCLSMEGADHIGSAINHQAEACSTALRSLCVAGVQIPDMPLLL